MPRIREALVALEIPVPNICTPEEMVNDVEAGTAVTERSCPSYSAGEASPGASGSGADG
jgi:hypothetical protein